ncbi:MAG: agmatinase family protein [Planctomycetota bacterium]
MPINFLGIPNTPLKEAKFVILPLPYDVTTSYVKGTSSGPSAIIDASAQVETYDEELGQETYKKYGIHTLRKPPLDFNAKPEKFIPALNNYIKLLIKKLTPSQVLISLGGEHSVSYPIVKAYQEVKRANPPDQAFRAGMTPPGWTSVRTGSRAGFSVLHLDAHSDLREKYEGSIYNHACVMKRILDSGVKSIVQVGIRNLTPECMQLIRAGRHNKGQTILKTFFAHKHKAYKNMIHTILNTLADDVYVTIDLDVFDPALMPAVGTPEPGGLNWYEVLDVLRPVFQKKRVIALDVVELCPLKNSIYSDFTAAKLIYRLMGYFKK